MSTLVSGGRHAVTITSQLSNPTIATLSGTSIALSRNASAAARDLVVAAKQRVGWLGLAIE